jgi:acyl-CoA reductase-like NAD-dependent aldehyde dehydrogenase
VGYLKQTLFNIVYCNNSLITYDIYQLKTNRGNHESYGNFWVNNTILPAPFVGVKESGFGRENHKMALDHYRVEKQVNLLRQRTGWAL